MKKNLNKWTSVLATTVLFSSLAAPVVSAASNISVTAIQGVNASVNNEGYVDLGDIKIEVPISDLNNKDFFFLRLPSGYRINVPGNISSDTDLSSAVVMKPDGTSEPLIQSVGGSDPWKDGISNHISVFQTNANELKVVVNHPEKLVGGVADADTMLKINLGSVYVPGGADDTINATIEGKTGSAFSSGTVTIANKGKGMVSVSVDSVKTITEGANVALDTIRFKEDRPNAFAAGDSSLKLTLPNGFEWTNNTYTLNFVDGDSGAISQMVAKRSSDRRELDVNVSKGTNAASYFTLNNASIDVQDSTAAKYGDVSMNISGTSHTNMSSIVVGHYAPYGTIISTQNPTTVLAGRTGTGDPEHTEMGQLVLQENAPGSLRAGGTIQLKLTGGVKWAVDSKGQLAGAPVIDTALADTQGLTLDDSVGVHGWQLVGNSGDTIMATIKNASNGANGGKIVLDKGLLDVPADTTNGNVHLIVDGNAGISGDAGIVAQTLVPASISITDSTQKHVQAGVQDRLISDIVVKENMAGALNATGSGSYLRFTFQPGVMPELPDPSTLKVSGDLAVDASGMSVDKDVQGCWYIQVPIKSPSTTPSTITLSGVKVTADRTVPEGDLTVNLGGSMIQTSGVQTIGSIAAGKVVLPTNGNTMNSASFVIGSTAYNVNDASKTLDVAPFIDENGRSQLPVRAVSEALGAMVGWDPQDGTVTILKDGKAISITVGSYVMNVGGVFVQNDSPAINQGGRVFLPFRVIAEALGAKVDWDPTTKTVYLN